MQEISERQQTKCLLGNLAMMYSVPASSSPMTFFEAASFVLKTGFKRKWLIIEDLFFWGNNSRLYNEGSVFFNIIFYLFIYFCYGLVPFDLKLYTSCIVNSIKNSKFTSLLLGACMSPHTHKHLWIIHSIDHALLSFLWTYSRLHVFLFH